MKKTYVTPCVKTFETTLAQVLLTASVTSTDGNADIKYSGGGSGPARSRQHGGWDDYWDEE